MPRFAANLAYLFTEYPALERFAAASAEGFTAVELQFPYDQAPSAVKAELARHRLTMLGINTPPGNMHAGEFGLAAVPGRGKDLRGPFCPAPRDNTAGGGPAKPFPAGPGAPPPRFGGGGGLLFPSSA